MPSAKAGASLLPEFPVFYRGGSPARGKVGTPSCFGWSSMPSKYLPRSPTRRENGCWGPVVTAGNTLNVIWSGFFRGLICPPLHIARKDAAHGMATYRPWFLSCKYDSTTPGSVNAGRLSVITSLTEASASGLEADAAKEPTVRTPYIA